MRLSGKWFAIIIGVLIFLTIGNIFLISKLMSVPSVPENPDFSEETALPNETGTSNTVQKREAPKEGAADEAKQHAAHGQPAVKEEKGSVVARFFWHLLKWPLLFFFIAFVAIIWDRLYGQRFLRWIRRRF